MSTRKPPPKSGGKRPTSNRPRPAQAPTKTPATGEIPIADQAQPKLQSAVDKPSGGSRPVTNRSYQSRPATSTTVRRRTASPPPPPKNNSLPLIIIGGVLVIAVIVFVVAILLGGSGNQSSASTTPSAGDVPAGADPSAQVQTFPSQGGNHLDVAAGDTVQKLLNGAYYNSDPPTSGPHLPIWSNWGVFNQPIQNELQVHNLEHGGVVIQYDCPQGCPNTVNSLSSYARRYQPTSFTGILLAPRPNLPNGARIALTAWTHRLLLKTLDTDKINQFVTAYIGKGPEGDPNFRQ